MYQDRVYQSNFNRFLRMLEIFTFSSLPSFLLTDGKIPSQRVHLQFARRKNRRKEKKNKTKKSKQS